jgi:hypothetical protein
MCTDARIYYGFAKHFIQWARLHCTLEFLLAVVCWSRRSLTIRTEPFTYKHYMSQDSRLAMHCSPGGCEVDAIEQERCRQ